jgi:hypothetical protein
MITVHGVPAERFGYYRRYCKENNMDYVDFLETSHKLMRSACSETENEESE